MTHPWTWAARCLLLLVVFPTVTVAGQEYWVVDSRSCPQVMGTDSWPYLKATQLDSRGCLSRRDPSEIIELAAVRPVILLVHGSYYSASQAATEGLRIRNDLAPYAAPDTVVVAFDWPSQHLYKNLIRDANDKARRAAVAGYHIARFLQMFPSGSRVTLIGHSHGGYTVLSALHLLGGGSLDDGCDPFRPSVLPEGPCLRLRAVLIASASDRQWLDPGERLGNALQACEGVLSLYNKLDPVLVIHPFGKYSEHHRALGKTGLSRLEEERLGPMATRYCERGIGSLLGPRHTFRGATDNPTIAWMIGPYLWPDECPTVSLSSPRHRATPSPRR